MRPDYETIVVVVRRPADQSHPWWVAFAHGEAACYSEEGGMIRWVASAPLLPSETVVCAVTLSEDADGNPVASVVRP